MSITDTAITGTLYTSTCPSDCTKIYGFTEEQLRELLKKSYYQGFQDKSTDNYENEETFIESLIPKTLP